MDKLLLKDDEYRITGTNTIKFKCPIKIEQKNIGIISQLPTAGIIYNGDCDGYQGSFNELTQVLTLDKVGVALQTDTELSVILLIENASQSETLDYLKKIADNTGAIHELIPLLKKQIELQNNMY